MTIIFLADGFEEIEAISPIDILRRGGVEVLTVGISGKIVSGSHGIHIECDTTDEELDLQGKIPDCVILPGGMPGTLNLEKNKIVKKVVSDVFVGGGLVCAICAAPSLLGQWGILDGKNAVCYPGFENKLIGATVCDSLVVRDGNIITAKGPGAALPFGFEILTALKGTEVCDKISLGMATK